MIQIIHYNEYFCILDYIDYVEYYWRDLPSVPHHLSMRVERSESVMICACFNATEKLDRFFTQTNINAFDYADILGNIFIT